MVGAVKGLGIETCVTLGMLTPKQATQLFDDGLDLRGSILCRVII
jgi:biotin synthase